MKKRLMLLFCLVCSIGLVTGCSLVRSNKNLNKATLVKETDTYAKSFFTYDFKSVVDQYKSVDKSTLDEETKNALDEYKGYIAAQKKYGGYKSKIKSKYTLSGDSATVSETIMTTSGKKAVFSCTFDENGKATDYKVEAYRSVGQNFGRACLNTVMGMLTVFAVLIVIALIISLFGVFFGNSSRKQENSVETVETAGEAVSAAEEDEENDLEVVAAIAAAIAASEGVSPDSLVVRSIKRRRIR